MSKPHILIDGDILIYEACFGVEQPIHWGNDMWTLHADAREAKQRLDVHIVELVETLNAGKYTVCLSDSENFRKDLEPSYKANRNGRKPIIYREVKDYVIEAWKAQVWGRLEADDVIGIKATSMKDTVIVSIDKDFKTVPGRIYNPSKADLGIYEVSPSEADRWHLIQTLTGDRVDGYSGCPGIGPKKAEAIADGGWPAVVDAYQKAGLSEEFAVTQARLARILRKGDYIRKTRRVKLWTPAMQAA